ADEQALADERVGTDAVLEHRGRDVLATGGDDDLLLASGDAEEAVVVERAQVARAEPSVLERLRGGLGVPAVAPRDVRALDEDLAVVGDLHRGPGQRDAHGADLRPARTVDGRRRRGLREAVALEDVQTETPVEVTEPLAQRGAAGDRPLRLAAEHG